MVSVKMQYEIANHYQTYESLQLVIAQALGGTVEEKSSSKNSPVKGTVIEDMNGLVAAFNTIGGKIG